MRHTFASHLMRLGVDAYTIMELGGWKSLEMVMRYSHLAPDHKQMAVKKLSQLYSSLQQ
jgi:site-specific recombinase XerD